MMSFGDRIKIASKGAGISLGKLAERMGVSRNTTYAWAEGAIPSLDKVEEAAKVLKVSPCWLAFGGEKIVPEPLDELALLRSIQLIEETAASLPPAEKAKLISSFYLLAKNQGIADLLKNPPK